MNKSQLLQEINKKELPKHIALILDGNGRWAQKRGLPRNLGHKQGAKNLYKIVKYAYELGIKAVTVYAFSTENWNRPVDEINYLMEEALRFKEEYKENIKKHNFRVKIIGEKDKLNNDVLTLIEETNNNTKDNNDFYFTICLNYGSRQEITNAVKEIALKVKNNEIDIDSINQDLISDHLYTNELPPLDLLIRTSGEVRISNFLLWQLAYTELYFTTVYWPDFSKVDLLNAIYHYQNRKRRFGGLDK